MLDPPLLTLSEPTGNGSLPVVNIVIRILSTGESFVTAKRRSLHTRHQWARQPLVGTTCDVE
jgi:hypothetical protein